MELLGKIRREKRSERAIAKRTGLSRNTVHKWLKTSDKVQTAQCRFAWNLTLSTCAWSERVNDFAPPMIMNLLRKAVMISD